MFISEQISPFLVFKCSYLILFNVELSVHMWYFVSMKDITEMIAKYIKTNRIRLKKTQKDLAEESGVSLMTLRRAENGEVLSLETLVAILEVFGDLESLKSLFVINDKTPRSLLSQNDEHRERVRKRKDEETKEWVWGDEIE